jgi:hypothetical protein
MLATKEFEKEFVQRSTNASISSCDAIALLAQDLEVAVGLWARKIGAQQNSHIQGDVLTPPCATFIQSTGVSKSLAFQCKWASKGGMHR